MLLRFLVMTTATAVDDAYYVLNGTAAAAPTRCLDGSPAGLYFRASPSASARPWVLYLEGGPDCADGARCASVLSAGGGTDAGLPPTLAAYFDGQWAGAALIDPSPAANPDVSMTLASSARTPRQNVTRAAAR
jgi:hypothetical protein